jgi:hypothetical protein
MASEDDRNEHREGPEAARRFETTLKRIVSVPKDELKKREAAYQKSRRAKKASAVRAR